jgi:GTP-binding protein
MAPSRDSSHGSFVDSATIQVRAGHGGRGSVSFRREPFVPRGGPDGGDGGRGGSVVLTATPEESSLAAYLRRKEWRAEDGRAGAGGLKSGRSGADARLPVPVGTAAYDSSGALLGDLDAPGAELVLASGGAGGRGNVHFKSSVNRAPRLAEPGLPGAELEVRLELRLIADAGLIGPPNAGKSSLLRAISAATPRVADYPFTTLDPQLGVAEVGYRGRRLVVADIPGLIEGAAGGAGLGLRFLRHVERTRVLVYLVDGSRPDPWADLAMIRKEVAAYSAELARRPSMMAVNKLDLPETQLLRRRTRRRGIYWVSAKTGEGVTELLEAIERELAAAPPPDLPEPASPVIKLRRKRGRPEPPRVERRPWGFEVGGPAVERLVERTNFDSEQGLQRFQVALDRLGVSSGLEEAGAEPGDTVRIGRVEFEYQP